jgi:hypothetical protein
VGVRGVWCRVVCTMDFVAPCTSLTTARMSRAHKVPLPLAPKQSLATPDTPTTQHRTRTTPPTTQHRTKRKPLNRQTKMNPTSKEERDVTNKVNGNVSEDLDNLVQERVALRGLVRGAGRLGVGNGGSCGGGDKGFARDDPVRHDCAPSLQIWRSARALHAKTETQR